MKRILSERRNSHIDLRIGHHGKECLTTYSVLTLLIYAYSIHRRYQLLVVLIFFGFVWPMIAVVSFQFSDESKMRV